MKQVSCLFFFRVFLHAYQKVLVVQYLFVRVFFFCGRLCGAVMRGAMHEQCLPFVFALVFFSRLCMCILCACTAICLGSFIS